jgi:outer membrane protein assembly factor BamB
MEELGGYDSEDFSVEMADMEVKKVGKFDRLWKIEPGGSILQMPLIVGDVIYFGSMNFNMYALNINTGELVWKFKCENMIGESSPLYWNGNIYFGSMDYNVYCLDATSGELRWKFRTNDSIYSTGIVAGGKVFIGGRDKFLYCLDAETGSLVWKFETQDEIAAAPGFHEGKVFIGSFDHNFYCIDADNGELIWKVQTQGEVHGMNPPPVKDGVVYFVSFDNFLRAVDISSGKVIWKFPTGQYGNASLPVIHEGRIYQSTRDGFLCCLTMEGRRVWKYVNPKHMAIPVIHDGKLYIGSEDENLYCFSLDGKKLWSYKVQGVVFMSYPVKDGRIYFPCWDCNLYCMDTETRHIVWKFRAEGSPSYLPPPYEGFEVRMKIPGSEFKEREIKRYDGGIAEEGEKVGSFYKSRITYQVSTQYASKGNYQVDSDEEAF